MTLPFENSKSNIFSLVNPNDFHCVVENHTASHSVMHIKIFNPANNETRILEFQLVLYFSGPMDWKGADFQLRPWEECVNLLSTLNKMHQINNMSSKMQKEIGEKHFHLYTVAAIDPMTEITILAGSGRLQSKE